MTVVCYHAVDPDWVSPLSVPPAEFAAQCEWFARSGRVVDLEQHETGRPGALAITFDDGFRSLRSEVLPLLSRHSLPATMFIVAQTLTPGGQPVDWVDTPPAWPLSTLTVDEVLEARAGGVRIGSHSWAHHDLTTLTEEECTRDLRDSRELLEELLQEPVPFLAYPRGRHDESVRRAAERAGYRRAFALPEGRETVGPFAVPRVGAFPGNGVLGLRVKCLSPYLAVRHSRTYPVLQRLARRVQAVASR
jgi:peptidoglycan/xylan/chitin deacetylase (PgdA/CDA1 family)